MSFLVQPPSPARPNRCQLFAPGSRPELFAKAAQSAADVITLDLEDSVAPNDKPAAREAIIKAVSEIDWGTKTLSVRINGLDTPFWHRDAVELIARAGERLDMIMLPKAGNAKDIYALDAVVSGVEAEIGRKRRVELEAIIETAAGSANVLEIAGASPRLKALHFGVADYAASMGMQITGIGGTQSGYGMLAPAETEGARGFFFADPWHDPITRMVAACRTYGLLPVDGPFGDFSDSDGYRAQATRSATLGCVGKWAIHPKQVAIANEVFTPSEAIHNQAKRILAAMEEAARQGQGAATLDGKLIDIASARQAQVIVRQMAVIRGEAV
ncbi:HpcH/HpaI aldolase/citrate lyase family protein [Neomegalonema perideroedes]|uniref:HpcH/HpaI aldolase/citrate lyase family protein n=1 Tax=Neomegalonema perideroedes TaxID=217219 RepID=UPI00035EDA5B|nr:CoA ester lyase [Neomegalonema perideroedes]